jgi:hypothetical protein
VFATEDCEKKSLNDLRFARVIRARNNAGVAAVPRQRAGTLVLAKN